jgi:FMN phosphatase YigB (HAD superfamily)
MRPNALNGLRSIGVNGSIRVRFDRCEGATVGMTPQGGTHIQHIVWDLGGTLITPPPGGQDLVPLSRYPSIALRPSAAFVLEQLSQAGFRHAILSNTATTDASDARRVLLRLGVLQHFDVVVATQSELDPDRPGKPDAAVFRDVLRAWGVRPDHAVMVGNTFEHDVVGANRAGLHAVFLTNPEVSVPRSDPTALLTPPWTIPAFDLSDVVRAVHLLNAALGADPVA